MKYAVALLAGYLFGTINPAYIIGKIKGTDIREHGSFNAGASNAALTFGWWAFFIVVIIDFAKTIFAMLAIRYFYGDFSLFVLAGCASVVGHNFPFYMGFRGGKGFACYIALVLMIDWKLCLILLAVGAVLSFSLNWVVCATLTYTIAMPVCMTVFLPGELMAIIFVSLTSLLIISRHIVNFKRLVQHKEIGINKCYVGTKIKAEEKSAE